MKAIWLIPLFIASLATAQSNTYSTVFPLTENPISEGGSWVNGGTVGLDWTNVATIKGLAYGPAYLGSGFNDSTAVLTGTWSGNQSATAIVSNPTQIFGSTNEVELRLNTKIAAHSITGYELNCSVTPPGNSYMHIVRWNGGLGQFTVIATETTTGCSPGDSLTFNNTNGTLTALKNGKVYLTIKDTTYTNGSPGIGFDNTTSTTVEQQFGFSSFTATGLVSGGGGGGGTPPPSVAVTWTAAVPGNDPAVSYNVYRNAAKIGSSTTTSFNDANVAEGSSYSYYVTSVDAAGSESVPSNTATVTIPSGSQTTPNPPTGVTATPTA